MRVYLKINSRGQKWCRTHNIKKRNLEKALNIILEKEFPNKRIEREILVKINNQEGSGYYFGVPEIEIGLGGLKYETKIPEVTYVVKDLLHEFRHWIQDNLLNVKDGDLDYTLEDIDNFTNKYYRNKWEVDARRFAAKHYKKVLKLITEDK